MSDKNERNTGLLLTLIAVLTASFAPSLVKLGVDDTNNSVTLLMLRLLMAAGIFWVFYSIVQPAILKIDFRGILFTLLAGAVNSTGLLLFYLAIQYIDASVATLLFSSYPLFTIIMLSLNGEIIHIRSLLYMGLSLFGIYLIVNVEGAFNIVGSLLVMGCSFGYALHLNIVQWKLSDYPAQTSAIYIITFMAIITSMIWFFGPRSVSNISTDGWISIGGTAILSTVITRLTLFAAIRKIGSAQVSFFGPLEILLGLLLAVIFFCE